MAQNKHAPPEPDVADRRAHVAWQVLRSDPRFWTAAVLLGTLVLMVVFPSLFTSENPYDCRLGRSLQPPTSGHPFGFDLQGCDYLATIVHGARTSLLIGVTVVAAAAAIGVALGSVAGYAGGRLDGLISRIADIWLSIPLVLGGMFFLSFIDDRGIVQVTLVLTLLSWPAMARLTRSSVQQTASAEFVLAARALGASPTRVLTRHVIPHSLRPVVVYSALFIATAISAEAILSYMGVGLQLPELSWGLMLGRIRDRLAGHPHLLTPGVFLAGTVLGFVLFADALRSVYDPR